MKADQMPTKDHAAGSYEPSAVDLLDEAIESIDDALERFSNSADVRGSEVRRTLRWIRSAVDEARKSIGDAS